MTPEQLDEIENRQAAAMWIGGPTAAFAQDTLLLVKALREAWGERDKYKAALDAELPAAWREDIESLNSCLERIGKERDEARAEVARLRDIVAVNDQRLADVWDTAKRVLKGEG